MPSAAEPSPLQGSWDGDGPGGKCSITITGNTLHFHARTDFWYKATFTLPAGTGPQQLRAIINDGAQGKTDSTVGKVVVAIFKIEDGTLTLALNQDNEGPLPNAFPSERDGPIARYDLKKVQPQKKSPQPSKTQ